MINFTRLLGAVPDVSEVLKEFSKKEAGTKISGPVTVFNITRRCNLSCRHCYLKSEDTGYSGELELSQIKKIITDLKKADIPVLLLSGGEPLMHKGIFPIIEHAKNLGLRVGLSTNGTKITKKIAKQLKRIGLDYAGVSIDGLRNTHNKFRNYNGAFDMAMKGIINSLEAGLNTGMRFTISRANYTELLQILDLCIKEQIPRFCMYHLVYSGRASDLKQADINNHQRRNIIDLLIKKTIEFYKQKYNIEILTVDNHADGIYIYNHIKKTDPLRGNDVLKLLKRHGGCSAGQKVVDISQKAEVFACQFYRSNILGNLLEKDFSKLWYDNSSEFLCRLRSKTQYLKGKCSRCRYKEYCCGCRVRALAVYNDFWQEDPCCYLTEDEIK